MSRTHFDDLASRWVPGVAAPCVELVTTGLSNVTCRVARDGSLYSMRVATRKREGLGLDHGWECAVLNAAAAARIGPVIRCCNDAAGILVADWVAGRTWSTHEVRLPANLDAMAGLLRQVHSLSIPPPAHHRDPRYWIERYRDALAECAAPGPLRSGEFHSVAVAHLAQLVPQATAAPVLCHSDLHRLNLLIADRSLVLLDWEYAHVSDAFWDLAGWVANNDMSNLDAERLLASYLRRSPLDAERARLRTWAWLYDYICLLWSELFACWCPGLPSQEALARAEIVAMRLRGE